MGQAQHWERIYAEKQPEEVSWYEQAPETSLTLIEEAAIRRSAAIVDVGGGTSRLAGRLIAAGYADVTVADISRAALERARVELAAAAERVTLIHADVRSHDFGRRFDLWHDRAVFHFMVDAASRNGYLTVLRRTLRAGGHLVLAGFGPGGPTHCSGLRVARYGPNELSSTLGSDFNLISSRTEEHRTPTGHIQEFVFTHFRRIPRQDPR